jgi:hypothetical protein
MRATIRDSLASALLLCSVAHLGGASAEPIVKIASTPEASPLSRQLLQVVWEGASAPIELIEGVDGALDALGDGVVDGVMLMESEAPSSTAVRVATSELWWATRADERSITATEWSALLRGLPTAPPRQLCLRALPDPLERAWIKRHPQDAPLLTALRRTGRALIFYDEEALLRHLLKRRDAIALFDAGRLRQFGAPLARLQIESAKEVTLHLWYLSSELGARRSEALSAWERLLRSQSHVPWLRDLGWRAP